MPFLRHAAGQGRHLRMGAEMLGAVRAGRHAERGPAVADDVFAKIALEGLAIAQIAGRQVQVRPHPGLEARDMPRTDGDALAVAEA